MQPSAAQNSGTGHNPTPHYQKLHADFHSLHAVNNMLDDKQQVLYTATTKTHMPNLV